MELKEQFRQLVQLSLGFRTRFDEAPTGAQWTELYTEADKQSLLPFLFTGMDQLEADQMAPFKVRARFAVRTYQIVEKNAVLDARAAELSSILSEEGFGSCLLKGQGVAMLYEYPERRQCGDIDIWVGGGIAKVLPMLRSKWNVGSVVYHHADVRIFDDAEVEVHFRPTWMYNPFTNYRLQRWFDACAPKQFSNMSSKGFAVPDCSFNLVYSLIHIYRHLFDEGIGLRQLTDYCHILMHSDAREREEAYKVLRSLRMGRFCAAIMWIMQSYFGLDADCRSGEAQHLLCEPDAAAGQPILQTVLSGGNFGRHEELNRHSAGEGLLGRIIRKARLKTRFLFLYPQEILWSPIFKTWQYIWRRIHGYA